MTKLLLLRRILLSKSFLTLGDMVKKEKTIEKIFFFLIQNIEIMSKNEGGVYFNLPSGFTKLCGPSMHFVNLCTLTKLNS